MTKILFVCLGNICRSPLAEAIFHQEIRRRRLTDRFYAESCGTANYHVGDAPDPRTIANAARNGTPIQHVGRQFEVADFKKFDLILAMDASNRMNLLRLPDAKNFQDKIKMMRSYDTVDRGADVPDPYTGGEEDFQEVYDILRRSVGSLVDSLTKA
ncbi:MAG TPA: low molecular weight protein-tyrosine-phosphatase [Cyclobacteriaceae bacterium]|nr:low molecular weight protein-tyrosine-phosphatase [Cyclobacteriaceae bacterium]